MVSIFRSRSSDRAIIRLCLFHFVQANGLLILVTLAPQVTLVFVVAWPPKFSSCTPSQELVLSPLFLHNRTIFE